MERIIPSIIFFQTTNQPWLCWINISRKPSNLWNNQRSLQMGYCISEMFGNAIWPKSARLSSGWASAHWFAAMYRLTDMAMEPIATALAKLKIYESYVYIYIYVHSSFGITVYVDINIYIYIYPQKNWNFNRYQIRRELLVIWLRRATVIPVINNQPSLAKGPLLVPSFEWKPIPWFN